MATDIERLVIQMSADLKSFEREMQRASGISSRQARAIENSFRQANRQLDGIGRSMAGAITGPLAAIGGALSTREILRYADAWTAAQNSLAIAGVTGAKQAAVLDELFKSAQANGAPISALTTLYGRAAQVSTELGASQGDLIRFSDGVAVALRVAGTDATQASGALLQLGQALGSGKVAAEEFNSIQEGARPILQAVAAGLDEAGGSVAKLKTIVNDGRLTSKAFFEAFLKGLPTLQAQASQATQTVGQAITKLQNALTKYVGETDESLGATQRLVAGLNVMADNFSKTADLVLQVAAVIAGALVGRAIGGMIKSLGLAGISLVQFIGALRTAQTAFTLAGVAGAFGPIGAIIGTVVAGLAIFSTTSAQSAANSRLFKDELAKVRAEAERTAPAIADVNKRLEDYERAQTQTAIRGGEETIANIRKELELLAVQLSMSEASYVFTPAQQQQAIDMIRRFNDGKISAEDLKNGIGRLTSANPSFAPFLSSIADIIARMADAEKAAENLRRKLASIGTAAQTVLNPPDEQANARSTENFDRLLETGRRLTADLERRNALSSDQIKLLDKAKEITEQIQRQGGEITEAEARRQAQLAIAADKRREAEDKSSSSRQRRTPDDAFAREIQAIKDRTAALVLEQEIVGKGVAEQERRRMQLELEQQALRRVQDAARQAGDANWRNVQLTQAQRDAIKEVAAAYGEQSAALQRVQENQQRAQQAADEFYSTMRQGFIDSITRAKSLGDALGSIAKKLGDLALGGLFDSIFKPAGGGGLFGGLSRLEART